MKSYTAANFQSDMQAPHPRRVELAYLQARIESAEALLAQSQALVGSIYTERGLMSVADAILVFEVGTVLYRFGTWVVTDDGIACLVHHYPLTRARLHESQDWASHLAEQDWVCLWDFLRAVVVATQPRMRHPADGSHGGETQPS